MKRRLFLLLLLALVVVALWRPDWRLAAQRAAAPYVERAIAPLRERAASVRVGSRPTPPSPVPDRATVDQPGPTTRPGGATRRHPQSQGSGGSTGEIAPPAAEPTVGSAGNLPPRLPALRPY